MALVESKFQRTESVAIHEEKQRQNAKTETQKQAQTPQNPLPVGWYHKAPNSNARGVKSTPEDATRQISSPATKPGASPLSSRAAFP